MAVLIDLPRRPLLVKLVRIQCENCSWEGIAGASREEGILGTLPSEESPGGHRIACPKCSKLLPDYIAWVELPAQEDGTHDTEDRRECIFPRSTANPSVFDWLGADPDGSDYYLHPLNLQWSKLGADHDIDIFAKVAKRIERNADCFPEIIRDVNWRFQLIGYVCLLATGNRKYFEDLAFRYTGGSMIAPQLAVALGLLHPTRSVSIFENAITQASPKDDQYICSIEALRLLGQECPVSPPSLPWWEEQDLELRRKILREHWTFWQSRGVPIT
jgi:hypothetical protein